jgi:ATP-binding cassette, subfamily G (WHITE), member 2, PDR
MYRVSPLTYFVGGTASTSLSNLNVTCSASEMVVVNPPTGQTCQQYLQGYLSQAPGTLVNPNAMESCQYCPFSSSNEFLANSEIFWNQRWRDFGIVWAYIGFNTFAAFALYWLFRGRSKSVKFTDVFWRTA